jgi:hypothetical protein
MNAQNLRFLRNGFTQGWTMRLLDSVGATPTGATESRKAFGPLPFPSPRPRANGKIFTYLRLFSLMFAYLRLMGEKMFEGRDRVNKPVDRAKSTSGTIAVRPTSTASQNFDFPKLMFAVERAFCYESPGSNKKKPGSPCRLAAWLGGTRRDWDGRAVVLDYWVAVGLPARG